MIAQPNSFDNPSDHKMDQLEDKLIIFIRLDLSLLTRSSTDIKTCQQAAADVLQACFGRETMEIVGQLLGGG